MFLFLSFMSIQLVRIIYSIVGIFIKVKIFFLVSGTDTMMVEGVLHARQSIKKFRILILAMARKEKK